MNPKFNL